MKRKFALAVLAVFACGLPPASAVDLAKIGRTIAKEPAYHAKPKYCLVVFGPEAKTRVWLVLDGDTLFVDVNGNGDLTEAGERFRCEKAEPGSDHASYPFAEIRYFPAIARIPAQGERKYTRFKVTHTTIKKDFMPNNRDNRELQAQFAKDPTLTRAGIDVLIDDKVAMQAVSLWADRPADAPICHIDGPLTMAPLASLELPRGPEPSELNFCLGTRGLGKGGTDAFAILYYANIVPEDVHPVAALEFSRKDTGKPAIKVQQTLKRC